MTNLEYQDGGQKKKSQNKISCSAEGCDLSYMIWMWTMLKNNNTSVKFKDYLERTRSWLKPRKTISQVNSG